MTPTTTTIARVQKTVFDLSKFDDVTLVKDVTLPSKPATLADALAAAGNDEEKLLALIHEGLISETKETARNSMEGFLEVAEDGETETPYNGKFADEEQGKLINGAVLSIAKMNGYAKSLTPEKKREIKEKAKKFLRDNPAMLGALAAPTASETPAADAA